jgi:hypothetical protein
LYEKANTGRRIEANFFPIHLFNASGLNGRNRFGPVLCIARAGFLPLAPPYEDTDKGYDPSSAMTPPLSISGSSNAE